MSQPMTGTSSAAALAHFLAQLQDQIPDKQLRIHPRQVAYKNEKERTERAIRQYYYLACYSAITRLFTRFATLPATRFALHRCHAWLIESPTPPPYAIQCLANCKTLVNLVAHNYLHHATPN
jgi:hypothetical protein